MANSFLFMNYPDTGGNYNPGYPQGLYPTLPGGGVDWGHPTYLGPRQGAGGSQFAPPSGGTFNLPGGNNSFYDINYDPLNQSMGQGQGGGQQGGGAPNFLSWLIPGLTNLAGGYLNNRAQKGSDQANRDAIKDRIAMALSQLSPEMIASLTKVFLPHVMSTLNPLGQTAIQGLATSQAKKGLASSPISLTAEAGLRGQLANAGNQQAFEQAMQLASQRAGAITGTPIFQQQPNFSMGNAFTNAVSSGLAGYALTRQPQPRPQYQAPSPYTVNQYGTPRQGGYFNPVVG